jgi:DNA-binding SARP family transcriptional activator/WD40 repeat protein
MDFHILGPLEALDEGRTIPLSGSKQRALLALLLLHPNETLSRDRLIDELWGEHPPDTATKTVQVHVSRLRKTLGAAAGNGVNGLLVTRDHGYELTLAEEQLDARQFERLLVEGSQELRAGRPELAVPALERALSLWRGPALADLAYEPFLQREIARLEDLRIDALEQLIDAKLALGRHTEVIGQLETLIGEHPYRERLHAQLMLALYRSERQADALQAYQNARRTLVGELGIEPGERLRALEQGILNQDPQLELPAVEPVELPPELDMSTLLAGRETELGWVQEHWSTARRGGGRLVLISGARGIGKTRLVAELAGEVQRDGGAVRYVSGTSGSDDAEEALAAAKAARRPTLLVFDDVDRGGERQIRALNGLAKKLAGLPVLVVATSLDSGLATRVRADATLDLGPLDDGGVLAVARLYAGARDDAEVPVEQLAEVSGGIPLRVHRAAGEWARVEASRRLSVAADLAQEERTGLRAAEDKLAGNVVELQAVRERAELGDRERVVACPFKGLGLFDVEDAEVFFGRERLVAEMVARLAGAPLMGVVGPSGSGKSSALRAGLLAALSGGVLPGSEHWALALLRPGAHPLRALEQATAESPRQGRLVIAVDQFEEVFTACRDESERAAFVDALVACARDTRRRALVLVAVRADFYGRCAAYPELSRLLGANHVLVGPMQRDELRRAIELPARRAGLQVEPELVDALLADVEGEPGALPLLSTSLLELWQRRDGRRLRMSAYQHAGGVHGAVARLAESAWERLEPEHGDAARRILLRLAGEGEGEAVVRRRVPLAELEPERDEAVADVLAVLGSERLVTIGEGEVEVAHEALLREWPRLRGWLEQDAEARRLHRHITLAAREWDAGGRDPGELYRGARLASALDLAAEHGDALNRLEREFLDEARLVSERESMRARRMNRGLRMLLAGALVALVAAGVLGLVALDQRGDARRTATVAEAERLGAQALTVDELDRALLLARTGVALEDSVATRGNLLAALLRVPRGSLGVLPDVRDNAIYGIALSPRGDRIAIGDHVGEVRLFDARTRRELGSYRLQQGLVQRLAFSPDGATLAVVGQEPENEPPGALIDVLDARTLERRQRIVLPPPPEGGIAFASPVFTADGRALTVLQIPFTGPPQPNAVFRVDLDRGAVVGRPFRFPGGGSDPAHSSDRRSLFVTSEPEDVTYELDTADLRVIARHPAGGSAVALHPDEDLLAVGAADGSVRFVELPSGRVHPLAGKHAAQVSAMKFSADGRTLVSGDSNGGLIAWDVEHRVLRERLEGHAAEVSTVVTTPDGRAAISAGSNDGKVAFWDLDDSRRLVRGVPLASRFVADESTPRGVAVSPDDRTLAVTHEHGTVELLDTSTLEPRAVLEAFDEIALATDFSPDGRLLAVAGDKGELGLWDARTLAPVRRLEGLRGWIQALAFSPDGRLVAAGDNSGDNPRVLIWDVGGGRRTAFESDFPPSQLTFSPDGRLLAGAGRERGVEVRDVASGRLVGKPRLDEMARSVAFSPDGRLLFVGLYDGTGMFFSTEDWKPAGPGIRGHGQRILNSRFTPDGRTLATSSADGTVQLWDVASRRSIGAPLVVERDVFVASVLSRDGSYLYALPTGTEGTRLTLAPRLWRDLACAIAGRELTRREWEEVLPDRPYREVCAPA